MVDKGPFSEDIFIGYCMQSAGVNIGNSRDSQGRSRFQPFKMELMFSRKYLPKWYRKYADQLPKEVGFFVLPFLYNLVYV